MCRGSRLAIRGEESNRQDASPGKADFKEKEVCKCGGNEEWGD
jgi:hypothetical protein